MTPLTAHIQLEFERRLLEHPAAYHLRRMRMALWLYLELVSRIPAGEDTVAVDPAEIAPTMGLVEGTVRSWLGHLRRMHYVDIRRQGGTALVRIGRLGLPDVRPVAPAADDRFFTVARIERALGERGNAGDLEAALKFPDPVIRRALATTLAVPDRRIRKSRTALFTYLLKRYANEISPDSRP
jgi:DNA-binding transcriptional ArsR family regulator